MQTKTESKNLFLKRIAKHIGALPYTSQDFFESCETMIGQGGASNYFVYCSENREFLVSNKNLIQEILLQFYEDIGEMPSEDKFQCFGQKLDSETGREILGFLYGGKVPPQGSGCDWIVWAAVETHLFAREEEISKKKWDR